MANKRVFQVQRMKSNGVDLAGVGTLSLEASYRNVVVSQVEGAFGQEDVDRAGLRIAVSLECADVLKARSILSAEPNPPLHTTTFWGRESGTATWKKYTIGSIVWTGINADFGKTSDAKMSLNGIVRFADGTVLLSGAIQLAENQANPPTDALLTPNRYYRPYGATFTPNGASAIALQHTESLRLGLSAEVNEDFSDVDIGHTAVDIRGWQALTVSLVHKESTKSGAGDVSAALLGAAKGVLTVTLLGRGGLANKTVTVNNLLWTGAPVRHSDGYSEFTLQGSAGWVKRDSPPVVYNLTTTPLFDIA